MAPRGPEVTLTARQNARLRNRLEALAKRAGLSERALAEKAGLSIGAVRSVGETAAGPTLGTLLALVRALGLQSVDQLLGPSGSVLLANQSRLEKTVGEPGMSVVMSADIEQ